MRLQYTKLTNKGVLLIGNQDLRSLIISLVHSFSFISFTNVYILIVSAYVKHTSRNTLRKLGKYLVSCDDTAAS